jgi:hypothetical protein
MSELTFQEDGHIYRLDGAEISGVTTIMQKVGITPWYPKGSGDQGRSIHQCLHYLDEDDLDWDTVPEVWQGYIDAWVAYKNTKPSDATIIRIEQPVYHRLYCYAGTPDRVWCLDAHRSWELEIDDMKTGQEEDFHALQLTAYALAEESMRDCTVAVLRNVYLKADGTFKVVERERDIKTWEAVLRVYNYGRKK